MAYASFFLNTKPNTCVSTISGNALNDGDHKTCSGKWYSRTKYSWRLVMKLCFRNQLCNFRSTTKRPSSRLLNSCSNLNFTVAWWRHQMEINRSPVNSPHKGRWCGALMFPLICDWICCWVNNRQAGDLRRHCAHYNIIVMVCQTTTHWIDKTFG